jgi:hypothetical protein
MAICQTGLAMRDVVGIFRNGTMHPIKAALKTIVEYQKSAKESWKCSTNDEHWQRIFMERMECYRECASVVRKAIKQTKGLTVAMDRESSEIKPVFRDEKDAREFARLVAEHQSRMLAEKTVDTQS